MKKRMKLKIVAGVVCLCSLFVVALAAPGTDGDPLISLSYIDDVLMPKIEQYVESKIAEIYSGGAETDNQTADVFTVVEAKEGDEIICSAGTELILRMGKAEIIATEKGGLADTTAGYDLANSTEMPANHLLIVPVADGRGIKAKSDIIVMIKGEYSIK